MARPVAPPWLRLPARLESPLVLLLVLALAAASIAMSALGAPLATPANPTGIIGFELAGSAARAAAILASWDEAARQAAHTQTLWDFGFIALYVVALAAWATGCTRRLPGGRAAGLGAGLAHAMPVAGLLDVVENLQILAQLAGGASAGPAAVAALCAALKFAIVAATLGYALIGTTALAVRALRHRER